MDNKESVPIPIDEDYELWMVLNQIDIGIERARENELRPFSLTPIQSAVIYIVKAIGERATPTEISRWLFREPNTISQLLIRMENQGIVKRQKNPKNRSSVVVVLTDMGNELFHRQEQQRKVVGRIFSCLSSEERAILRMFLMKLRDKTIAELAVRLLPAYP